MMKIDQVILGDNQFFGVNHMSQDRGHETYEQFKDLNEIKRILDYALDKGVTGVMFSTHPSIGNICDMIRADKRLRENMNIYVNVPYIIKYVSMVTEMGMYETIKSVISSQKGKKRLPFIAKSIWNAFTLNHMGIFERMIDVELAPFHGLNVKAVFLHNALCDLILGYHMTDILKGFDRYIRKKYHAIPAYGTLNLVSFLELLDEAKMPESLVMSGFNEVGFLMNPSREACEHTVKTTRHTVLAMATLASGCLKPEQAYSYLEKVGIKNVVVGLSSKTHADETFACIENHILRGSNR